MKKIYYINYRKGANFGPCKIELIKSIKLADWDLYNSLNKELNIGFEINSGWFTTKEFNQLKKDYNGNSKNVMTRKQFIDFWGWYA